MKNRIAFFFILLMISVGIYAQKIMKIGIIGLDTSHSTAFTELINSGSDETFSQGFRVVAAYPYGSKTIQSSYERIPGYIEKVKTQGVEIVSSIADLLDKVDCVLLETNDGRLHLEQAMEVFKAGKICYIDKPIGATLGDAIAIYEMAEKYNIPIFSSSALRFTPQNQKLRNNELGKILGADCYSPHKVEPTHPDFGFYGIHGVETLYTAMGTGCESVNRMSSDRGDVVVGRWKDGRIGIFRGITKGPQIYGGTAFTSKGAITVGGYQGYKVLLEQILTFFRTGVAPVSKEETIEIFTFMQASNMSKEQNGKIVTLEEAYQKGWKDAQKLIDELSQIIKDPSLMNQVTRKVQEFFGIEVEIQEPFLCELLTAADIQLDIECSDWRDAIIRSAQPLLDQGKIEDKYIDAMIDNVKENGAYIIISPEFALPHEGFDRGCNEVGMNLIRLKEPVTIEDIDGEIAKVRFFCCMSTEDHKKHMKAFFHLVNMLTNRGFKEELAAAKTPEEAADTIRKYEIRIK